MSECRYGEHNISAEKFLDKPNKDLYIPISHCEENIENSSIVVNRNKITEKQLKWIKNNIEKLDSTHVKILKEKKYYIIYFHAFNI